MSKYDENERIWRKGYNQRPEVKARQKQHTKKYISKPDVRERLREYNKNYMKTYWKTYPEKYLLHKSRIKEKKLMIKNNQ